eukprot:Hpha_TRINITY_DN34045_c0_g1::TRINITY_DN34045_c0_g1_i1::g.30573::m.30573
MLRMPFPSVSRLLRLSLVGCGRGAGKRFISGVAPDAVDLSFLHSPSPSTWKVDNGRLLSGVHSSAAETLSARLAAGARGRELVPLETRMASAAAGADPGMLRKVLRAYAEERVLMGRDILEAFVNRAERVTLQSAPQVLSGARRDCFWYLRTGPKASGAEEGPAFASRQFLLALAPRLEERMRDIHPITAVYVCWTYAKSRNADSAEGIELLGAAAKHIAKGLNRLDRCGLAMSVWNYAYGGLGAEHKSFFKAAAREILLDERGRDLTPRDIHNIAQAYAVALPSHHSLFAGLADLGCRWLQKCPNLLRKVMHPWKQGEKVDNWDLHLLSDTLHAFALAQQPAANFASLALRWAERELHGLLPLSRHARQCEVSGRVISRLLKGVAVQRKLADNGCEADQAEELRVHAQGFCRAAKPHWQAAERHLEVGEHHRLDAAKALASLRLSQTLLGLAVDLGPEPQPGVSAQTAKENFAAGWRAAARGGK